MRTFVALTGTILLLVLLTSVPVSVVQSDGGSSSSFAFSSLSSQMFSMSSLSVSSMSSLSSSSAMSFSSLSSSASSVTTCDDPPVDMTIPEFFAYVQGMLDDNLTDDEMDCVFAKMPEGDYLDLLPAWKNAMLEPDPGQPDPFPLTYTGTEYPDLYDLLSTDSYDPSEAEAELDNLLASFDWSIPYMNSTACAANTTCAFLTADENVAELEKKAVELHAKAVKAHNALNAKYLIAYNDYKAKKDALIVPKLKGIAQANALIKYKKLSDQLKVIHDKLDASCTQLVAARGNLLLGKGYIDAGKAATAVADKKYNFLESMKFPEAAATQDKAAAVSLEEANAELVKYFQIQGGQ